MSGIIIAKDIDDLERIMKKGYYHDSVVIRSILNISKTQFYNYIYKDVSKLKINKEYRDMLKERNVYAADDNNDYLYSLAVTYITKLNISVLFNLEEILNHLINSELISYELYNKGNNEYLKLSKEEIKDSYFLLYKALLNAKKSNDLYEKLIHDPVDNYKTMRSKFNAKIKNENHFRIIVCGKRLYSIIENIEIEEKIIFKIYDESMKLLDEVRKD